MNLSCLEVARAAGLQPGRNAGKEALFYCPCHDDKHPSLSINPAKNAWLCGPCGKSGNAWELVAFIIGISPDDKKAVASWLREKGLLADNGGTRIVAEYDYRDDSGKLLFQTIRMEPKDFRQRRPDGNRGWIWKLDGMRLVPYRLNEWKGEKWVCIVEGEKDADNLRKLKFPATCNPMGAGKWREEYNYWFTGKKVVILPDNDEPGEKHAKDVAKNLFSIAAAVKIVPLPNLPPKGDVSDFIAAGGNRQRLVEIIKAADPLSKTEVDSWQRPQVSESQAEAIPPQFPTLAKEAFLGLAGEIVRAVDPFTEADPASVLAHLLTAFGNLIGCGPHFHISNDRHPARLFIVIVGDSAKARKGTSWGPIQEILDRVDSSYASERIRGGLSTGEGLIYHVRDGAGEDSGVADKRLLCIEQEFSSMLSVMSRPGNSLSGVIRKSWDSGNLSTLTRNHALTATNAHIGIIGHSTRDELLRQLSGTEQANGFANRFLWLMARRSKALPNGASVPADILEGLARKLGEAVKVATGIGEVRRNSAAGVLWEEIYEELSAGRPGLRGAILNRAETQVVRLSLTYALMDSSPTVSVEHLQAAVAFWDYCEASAAWIFGDATGNADADRIIEALKQSSEKRLSDDEIGTQVFKGHGAGRKAIALSELERLGRVKQERIPTSGRSRTEWVLAG